MANYASIWGLMKETFSKETVAHLSKLCRISCTEEEIESLTSSIKKIVLHIEQMQELDTEGVEPCYDVIAHDMSALRDDIVHNNISREDFLANAPEHIGGMIRIPKVLS